MLYLETRLMSRLNLFVNEVLDEEQRSSTLKHPPRVSSQKFPMSWTLQAYDMTGRVANRQVSFQGRIFAPFNSTRELFALTGIFLYIVYLRNGGLVCARATQTHSGWICGTLPGINFGIVCQTLISRSESEARPKKLEISSESFIRTSVIWCTAHLRRLN